MGEAIYRQDSLVDMEDFTQRMSDFLAACPQMTAKAKPSANSISLPTIMQLQALQALPVADLGDGSTGLRMEVNAIIVKFYFDMMFTAVDNYIVTTSTSGIAPHPKLLRTMAERAAHRLQTRLATPSPSSDTTVTATPTPSSTP